MHISERQEQIIAYIEKEGFLTVNRLAQLTYASPSSIRRDLSKLESLSLLKRTHGGAKRYNDENQTPPLTNRMSLNVAAKRKIAKSAAVLLKDHQVVMLDGSTTASFMIPYIAKHNHMTVFCNNMLTVMESIRHGINTHCIGGRSVNASAVLSGEESYTQAGKIFSDIFFFSSAALDDNGIISDPTESENHLRHIMLNNTRQSVFLCDSDKFGKRAPFALTNLEHVDFAVFNQPWDALIVHCRILHTNNNETTKALITKNAPL